MNYLIAGSISFISVFFKGFQHRNVNGNHYKLITITSYIMAFMDVILIGTISKSHWTVAFSCGTGAAIGMISSILLHDKLIGKKNG